MHETIEVASKALGAWMYLDQHEYGVSNDPDAAMRRIIERCLTGEARKKTQSGRMDIQKQREKIQSLREALEDQEWSENLQERVVELRRNLASLLLELCESNVDNIAHQEQIADSREQKDRVSEAVHLSEDGAAYNERRQLLNETEQTVKELELDEKEEGKRIAGRITAANDKGKKEQSFES